jgi:hypothetical protein
MVKLFGTLFARFPRGASMSVPYYMETLRLIAEAAPVEAVREALTRISDPDLAGKTWEQVIESQRLDHREDVSGDQFCGQMFVKWIYANFASAALKRVDEVAVENDRLRSILGKLVEAVKSYRKSGGHVMDAARLIELCEEASDAK